MELILDLDERRLEAIAETCTLVLRKTNRLLHLSARCASAAGNGIRFSVIPHCINFIEFMGGFQIICTYDRPPVAADPTHPDMVPEEIKTARHIVVTIYHTGITLPKPEGPHSRVEFFQEDLTVVPRQPNTNQ